MDWPNLSIAGFCGMQASLQVPETVMKKILLVSGLARAISILRFALGSWATAGTQANSKIVKFAARLTARLLGAAKDR
jgi:hypothetical protein